MPTSSFTGLTAPTDADREIRRRAHGQYSQATRVDVVVVGADGTIAPASRAILKEVTGLWDDAGANAQHACGDSYNTIIAALARVEARSYAAWSASAGQARCIAAHRAASAAVMGVAPAEDSG